MDDKNTFLIEEYKQIGESVRKGWDLVFSFFRHFILVQLLLASIFGIQKIDGNLLPIKTEVENPQSHGSIMKITATPNANNPKPYDKSVLIMLAVFGFVISIGGFVYNLKLIEISENFVKRAQKIEREFYKDEYKDKDKSHFSYMCQRIEENKKTKWMLIGVYIFGSCVWAYYFYNSISLSINI
ncbi:MAG: hypothetical protein FE834_09865 [Gammaproteobacteria bacterium]|nr:hypothetical protein [Gammaproteobacteria bacterium]